MSRDLDDKEEQQAADFLLHLARRDHPRLPTASQVWWRASIIRRLARDEGAVRRVERPARWSLAIGLALSVWILFMAVATSLVMSEGPAVGSEMIALAVGMVLPLVPTAGLVVLLFKQG